MRIRFLSRASNELAAAIDFYEQQRIGLGNELITELDHTLEVISQFPNAWPKFGTNLRRALLRRFPYGVLYRQSETEITVAAVMDLRQDPDDYPEA